jgi:hypothetical protein
MDVRGSRSGALPQGEDLPVRITQEDGQAMQKV